MNVNLIVADPAPLVALALTGRLDALLAPGWPVTIPDAVCRGAVVHPELGVAVFEWARDNEDRVRVALTEAGIEHDVLLRAGRVKPSTTARGSANEVVRRFMNGAPDRRAAVLIGDDTRLFSTPARAEPMTLGEFLGALEQGWEAGLAAIARENERAWAESQARGQAALADLLASHVEAPQCGVGR